MVQRRLTIFRTWRDVSRHDVADTNLLVLRCATFFSILESNDDCKSPEGVDVKHQELTKQEKEFYDMSKELSCDKHHPNTIQFFMTYCPESLSYLLDR